MGNDWRAFGGEDAIKEGRQLSFWINVDIRLVIH